MGFFLYQIKTSSFLPTLFFPIFLFLSQARDFSIRSYVAILVNAIASRFPRVIFTRVLFEIAA